MSSDIKQRTNALAGPLFLEKVICFGTSSVSL